MFVYGLAKGVRKGWLASSFMAAANKGYAGLKKEFVEQAGTERINLTKTVSVSGLGGKPKYRDGSFDYYISEKVITNDPKGMGAFVCAAAEMEVDQLPKPGKGLTVTVDNFFNNEYMTGPTGDKIPFHYLWEEDDNNGFSLFGKVDYSYKDRYLASLTFRRDGSSNFGPNNRYGNYPAGSVAWRLSEEEFITKLNESE